MGKRVTLVGVFSKFLIVSVLWFFGAILFNVLCMAGLVFSGQLNLARISETEAYRVLSRVETTDDYMEVLEHLSGRIQYAILDEDNQLLAGTMSEDLVEDAIQCLFNKNRINNSPNRYLSCVKGENRIVLYYRVEAYFTNDVVNEILPPVDIGFVMVSLLEIVIILYIRIKLLRNQIGKDLVPIIELAKEIGEQNLDCEVKGCDIAEFDQIQNALGQMKDELADAFQQNWRMQKIQQEQIAALTHDLKTPITIAMGNLDLLSETDISEEQREYILAATQGIMNLERYMQILREVSISSVEQRLDKKKVNIYDLQKSIKEQAQVLCKDKQIEFKLFTTVKESEYSFDRNLVERAILNIIINAIEYTPVEGRIQFKSWDEAGYLYFNIQDSGKGFSKKMLSSGVHLFQTEYEGRNGQEQHYGIGMYFADCVAKQHDGEILLNNESELGGANVVIKLKI